MLKILIFKENYLNSYYNDIPSIQAVSFLDFKPIEMGFKHLFGYFLTIMGIALAILLVFFLMTSQNINYDFYLSLGITSTVSVFFGILILRRAH